MLTPYVNLKQVNHFHITGLSVDDSDPCQDGQPSSVSKCGEINLLVNNNNSNNGGYLQYTGICRD